MFSTRAIYSERSEQISRRLEITTYPVQLPLTWGAIFLPHRTNSTKHQIARPPNHEASSCKLERFGFLPLSRTMRRNEMRRERGLCDRRQWHTQCPVRTNVVVMPTPALYKNPRLLQSIKGFTIQKPSRSRPLKLSLYHSPTGSPMQCRSSSHQDIPAIEPVPSHGTRCVGKERSISMQNTRDC